MVVCAPRFVRWITGNFARAIVLFPFIFIRYPEDRSNRRLLTHEKIHIRQQLELLVLPFYVWYLAEYIFRRMQHRDHLNAYLAISFEREAYACETDANYLNNRPLFAFREYL